MSIESKNIIRFVDKTEESSQIKIIVNDGDSSTNFLVNADMLKKRSPVFTVMLERDMIEKNTGVITISDIEPNIMEQTLRYIYGYPINTTELNEVFNLILVADKYQIDTLINECHCIMIDKFVLYDYMCLNGGKIDDLIIHILKFAYHHQMKNLIHYVEDCIAMTVFNMGNSSLEMLAHSMSIAENLQCDGAVNKLTICIIKNFVNNINFSLLLTKITLFSPSVQSQLKRECFKILQENSKLLHEDNTLLLISQDVLLEILDLENFDIINELDIINFVERWVWKFAEIKNPNETITLLKFREVLDSDNLGRKIVSKFRLLMLSKRACLTNTFLVSLLTPEDRKIICKAIEAAGTVNADFPSYLSTLTSRRSYTKCIKFREEYYEDSATNGYFLNVGIWSHIIKTNRIKCCKFSFKLMGPVACCLYGFRLFTPVKTQSNKNTDFNFNVHLKVYIEQEFYPIIEKNIDIKLGYEEDYKYYILYLDNTMPFKPNVKYIATLLYDTDLMLITYDKYMKQLKFADRNIIYFDGDLGPVRDFILQMV